MDLAQWLADEKLSDAELAAKVGVSRPFISRIRRGKRQPSITVAAKLCEITKLPLSAFIKDEAA